MSWNAPASDGGSAITGYKVQWKETAGGWDTPADVSETTVTGKTYTITGLTDGLEYAVRVIAVNDIGDGPPSSEETCPGGGYGPDPTPVEVDAVPIVVTSTTDDYFVLYVSHDVDGKEVEWPVLVKRGESGATTLAENLEALPAERYRVEKYLVADPADVDGDCVDDITELGDPVGMNPVNSAATIAPNIGAVVIPDLETFEELSYEFEGNLYVKFVLLDMLTDRPGLYFQNSKTYVIHFAFLQELELQGVRGTMTYDPEPTAPEGSSGVYRLELSTSSSYYYSFGFAARSYTYLAASLPLLDDNLAFHIPNSALPDIQSELPLYRESRINLLFDEDILGETKFVELNPGEGYGLLRVMEPDDRPNPRDIVIYEALPNELPRVAGIISTVPQTPLSHVNLRAVQDGVPNSFIRDALDNTEIDDLVDSHVHYTVTEDGWTLRAATPAEVDAHYASSRPATEQTPQRDLSVTEITPLSEIGFEDWDAFGVKAANVAVLGTLGFPEGTVPDGFAVPFYFYDEFMKHNGFYDDIEEMLADPDFQTDFDVQEDELKDLRKAVKKGEMPEWITEELTDMHATYPGGQSLRYRSSTNNEDLPGFNGAGLYDSKTQHPEETEEDGIAKSLKQVYASLWNFRAFTERDFNRIDHLAAAMGVLVHPNYSDELANGVAVSFDPIYGLDGKYYVNTQTGEDLVTNPEAHSVPEEILLGEYGYDVLATSNQAPPGQLLMSDDQMTQLYDRLTVVHEKFEELYSPAPGERFAMEVEFKITSDDILAVKQARPWVFSEAMAAVEPKPNSPATGQPTIEGTAQVGEMLTVDTSAIDDADGLDNVSYGYQWLADDTEIAGATDPTYTLVDDDASLTIKVKVSFFDDKSNPETLTSEATATVIAAVTPLTAGFRDAPDKHLGTGVFTFNIAFSEPISIGYVTLRDDSLDVTNGSATRARRVNGQGDLWEITVDPDSDAAVTVVLPITENCAAQDAVCTRDGTKLSNRSELTVPGPAAANSPATGLPAISGTAQMGETLTVDTSGIDDADGMSSAVFSYQWLANDAEITGATGDTFTLVEADVGKAVKVRVIFNDDDNNEETLTSEPTAAVAAETAVPDAPRSLNVSPDDTGTLDVSWEAPASDGDSDITGYKVQWKSGSEDYDGSAGSTRQAEITDPASRTHTITGLTDGVEYTVRVIATNDVGDGPPSDEVLGTPLEPPPLEAEFPSSPFSSWTHSGTDDRPQVVVAFSRPVASFTASTPSVSVAGGTLLSGQAHEEQGLENAYILFLDPAGTDAIQFNLVPNEPCDSGGICAKDGTTLSVVPVTHTILGPPTQNSPATGHPTISGKVEVGETLAASISGIADADGLDNAVFTYLWLADDVGIAGATGSSYTVVDADEEKTIKVRVTFTDDGGNQETLTSEPTAAVAAGSNSPATGAPTISGTARVGETLTASVGDIGDDDGIANAEFSYQWLADGAEITDATGGSYTLVDADAGKAIKVRASFTDDEGNAESLTSAATAVVEEAEPTEPPPKPTNLTARVNGDGSITLSWEAPDDDSVTGYQILRRRPTQGEDTLLVYVEDTGSTATTYTDTNVTAGVRHVYRVKAINSAGVGAQSNYVNPTP